MKRLLAPVVLLGVLASLPAPTFGAGLAGAIVDIVDPAGPTVIHAATTDATGAFVIEDVLAGFYQLVATDAAAARTATLDFSVDAAAAPARVRGLVTEDGLATVSFAVTAFVSPMSFVDVVIAAGYPRLQPKWNRNWARANGRLHVRLAGTGLDAVTGVSLASAIGSIPATRLVLDPEDGELHAVFPKGAAFTALAGDGAKRGDRLALQVGVTTLAGTQLFAKTVSIVGPKK